MDNIQVLCSILKSSFLSIHFCLDACNNYVGLHNYIKTSIKCIHKQFIKCLSSSFFESLCRYPSNQVLLPCACLQGCAQGQLDMEGALTARDRVGIQDFVLLDAHTSETAFLDNLKKRFSEDLIYVSLEVVDLVPTFNNIHSMMYNDATCRPLFVAIVEGKICYQQRSGKHLANVQLSIDRY